MELFSFWDFALCDVSRLRAQRVSILSALARGPAMDFCLLCKCPMGRSSVRRTSWLRCDRVITPRVVVHRLCKWLVRQNALRTSSSEEAPVSIHVSQDLLWQRTALWGDIPSLPKELRPTASRWHWLGAPFTANPALQDAAANAKADIPICEERSLAQLTL